MCITSDAGSKVECYHFQKNNSASGTYRGTDIVTNKVWVFSLQNSVPSSCAEKSSAKETKAVKPSSVPKTDAGPSAAEMAKKLANPSLAIGQMTSHFTTSQFRGTLPGSVNLT